MAVKEARVPTLREDRPARRHEPSPTPLAPAATLVTSLAAGAAAGALAKTAIAPLDRTKINFQISQTPYSWRAALLFLSATVRHEGVAALWRGNSATMARIIPYAAVQFTAHDQWKRVLGVDVPKEGQSHPVRLLIAGSLAGVTSQSATYPLDVARARMAVTPIISSNITSTANSAPTSNGMATSNGTVTTKRITRVTLRSVLSCAVREQGFMSLYRGYLVTVMGVVPYAGVSFFTYDTLKHQYHELVGSPARGPVLMCLGGAAGALGQTASYPLDIVRRRLQVARTASTARDTVRGIYRTEGWRGFFKGLSMNWVKGPIAVGISFASFQNEKKPNPLATYTRDSDSDEDGPYNSFFISSLVGFTIHWCDSELAWLGLYKPI